MWSTYLGGFSRDVANAVTNDAAGGVAVAGATSNAETFPLRDAFQSQVRQIDVCQVVGGGHAGNERVASGAYLI